MAWNLQVHGVALSVHDDGQVGLTTADGGVRLGAGALSALAQTLSALATVLQHAGSGAAIGAVAAPLRRGPGRPRRDRGFDIVRPPVGPALTGERAAPGRPRSDGATGAILDGGVQVKGRPAAAGKAAAGRATRGRPRGGRKAAASPASSDGSAAGAGSRSFNHKQVLEALGTWLTTEPGPKTLAQLANLALSQGLLHEPALAEQQVKSVVGRHRDRFLWVDGAYRLRAEPVRSPEIKARRNARRAQPS